VNPRDHRIDASDCSARAPLRLGLGGAARIFPRSANNMADTFSAINMFVSAVLELHENGPIRFVAADRQECIELEPSCDMPLEGALSYIRASTAGSCGISTVAARFR
jgi:hypothetical protein